jgi:hypothetical protein
MENIFLLHKKSVIILTMLGNRNQRQQLKQARVEIMRILRMDIVIVIAGIQRIILVVSVNLAQLIHMVLTDLAIVIMVIPRTIQRINVKNLTVHLIPMNQGALVCVTITM